MGEVRDRVDIRLLISEEDGVGSLLGVGQHVISCVHLHYIYVAFCLCIAPHEPYSYGFILSYDSFFFLRCD